MFQIIPVNSQLSEALEQLGTKRKFWFTDNKGKRILFKTDERGTGEDWSEKLACELCQLLGLPHVHYELAQETYNRNPGVICENIAPDSDSLDHGNELLLARNQDYPAENSAKYNVRQHTVDAVYDVMKNLKLPPEPFNSKLPPQIQSAIGVFIGYVMLDVWIGNQDRHHQNWGALRKKDGLYLAPTFDHAAGLARNLPDKKKEARLKTQDDGYNIASFVCKARSAFYLDSHSPKPIKTIDAWRKFSQFDKQASIIWLERLSGISKNNINNLLNKVPEHRLSALSRQFTLEFLMENRRRLLKEGGL